MRAHSPAIIKLAAAVVACSVLTMAGLVTSDYLARPQVSINELLSVPETTEQLRLFPPFSKGHVLKARDFAKGQDALSRPFTWQELDNHDTLDFYKRPDGSVEFAIEWYPSAVWAWRKLKHATVYDTYGVTIGEAAFRKNGTREMRAIRDSKGVYTISRYFDDGIVLSDLSVMQPKPGEWKSDVNGNLSPAVLLLSEVRWRKEGHTVKYRSQLNEDDSHDIVILDEHEQPYKQFHVDGGVSGTTSVIYFPGTAQVHISGESDYYFHKAKVFRKDGTQEMLLELGASESYVTYFDASGKRPLYLQRFSVDSVMRDDYNRLPQDPSKFRLYDFVTYGADGQPAREWDYNPKVKNGVWMYEEFGVLVVNPKAGQLPILCRHVSYSYNDDGYLEHVNYVPAEEGVKQWTVEHRPEEQLTAPASPSGYDVVPQMDNDLPVPPVVTMGGP